MTEDEARREAERLAREHPERATHHWLAQQGDGGDWRVVKVALPGAGRRPELRETVSAEERPPQPDDPREGPQRAFLDAAG
jgi:hypothetical protein